MTHPTLHAPSDPLRLTAIYLHYVSTLKRHCHLASLMPIPAALKQTFHLQTRHSARLEPGVLPATSQWSSQTQETLWVVPNWAEMLSHLPGAKPHEARPWIPRKGSYIMHTKLNLRKDPKTTTKMPERQKVTVSL